MMNFNIQERLSPFLVDDNPVSLVVSMTICQFPCEFMDVFVGEDYSHTFLVHAEVYKPSKMTRCSHVVLIPLSFVLFCTVIRGTALQDGTFAVL